MGGLVRHRGAHADFLGRHYTIASDKKFLNYIYIYILIYYDIWYDN